MIGLYCAFKKMSGGQRAHHLAEMQVTKVRNENCYRRKTVIGEIKSKRDQIRSYEKVALK